MNDIRRNCSSPALLAWSPARHSAPRKCPSLPDVRDALAPRLLSVGNDGVQTTPADSLCSSLVDLPELGSLTSLDIPGDLREDTPSPDSAQRLTDYRALTALAHDHAIGDIALALARLGERARQHALPDAVCAATEDALTGSLAQHTIPAIPGTSLART
jgi:hypothetical protein